MDNNSSRSTGDIPVKAIKQQCNGMLPEAVYQRIYAVARNSPGGGALEIGTAHGAATVCLALGLRDRGGNDCVHTVDRLQGGSRSKYGGLNDNRRILERNLTDFGVLDRVRLWVGDVEDVAMDIPLDKGVGVLMLDADGQIDRDWLLFQKHLYPDAGVIIDDVKDIVRVEKRGKGYGRVDMKMRVTRDLLSLLVRYDQISQGELVGNTYFGNHGQGELDAPEFLAAALRVYRQLVIFDAPLKVTSPMGEPARNARAMISRWFSAHPHIKRALKPISPF